MISLVPRDVIVVRGSRTLARLVALSARSLTRHFPHPSLTSPARIGVVVPTSADRQGLIDALLRQLDPTRLEVVVVATSPGVEVPEHVHLIEDFEGINIQRWWNKGINRLVELNCDIAVMVNDDVQVSHGALEQLATQLAHSRATVSTPGPRLQWFRHGLPLKWRMDGALWAINLHHGLRLDERYQWWMGDRDIEVRARTTYGGLLSVPVPYAHSPGSQTGMRADLQEFASQDMSAFGQHHAAVTRAMMYRSRISRRP